MSSSERTGFSARRAALAAAVLGALAAQGCTVKPLYMNAPISPATGQSYTADLASIAVKAVATREAQEVRNHLIFLLGHGQGQPTEPRYTLDLRVTSHSLPSAVIQVGTENEPSASSIEMRATYNLLNTKGEIIKTGVRQMSSSYDVPQQEFAALRARRDAENRAAREMAELIRLAVAQDLATLPAQ